MGTAVLFAVIFCTKIAFAQEVLPPLPTDYATSTPTEEETATATTTPVTYRATSYTASVTPTVQEVIDDAETGPVTILLIILSMIGGIGFILVKKYFDEKRYSL